jgi:hypothetical protein
VADLERGFRDAGTHQINWGASSVSPGIYFLRLRAGAVKATRTISILN